MTDLQLLEKQINQNNIINNYTCEYLSSKNRCSINMAKHFEIIDSIASYVFDREHYEIQLGITEIDWNELVIKLNLRLVIHFPKIIIKNSKNQQVPLKDMYVVFNFRSDETDSLRLDNTMRGFRTTFSNAEYTSNYAHSHLSGIYRTSINHKEYLKEDGFCLGNTEFAKMQSDLVSYPITDAKLKFIFMFVKEYLSWESLEGRPYRKLSEIFEKTGPVNEKVDLGILVPKIENLCKSFDFLKINNLHIGFSIEKDKFQIIEDQNYEYFLKRSFPSYLCYRDEKGDYYKKDNFEEPIYNSIPAIIPFHGKGLQLTVEKTNTTNDQATVLSPKVKTFVTNVLNMKINNTILKKYVEKGEIRATSN